MSIAVMSRVWKHSKAQGGELLVMLALADFSDEEGKSYPSVATLAEKARLSDRQVRRIIGRLEKEIGEIRRNKSNGRRSHTYLIIIPDNPDIMTLTKRPGRDSNPDILGSSTRTFEAVHIRKNRHRTVIREAAKKRGPIALVPSAKEFILWFGSERNRIFGAPYLPSWSKEVPLVTEMLKTLDLQRLKQAAEKFLNSDDPWIRQNGGFTIPTFRSQINKFTITPAQAQTRKGMPVADLG